MATKVRTLLYLPPRPVACGSYRLHVALMSEKVNGQTRHRWARPALIALVVVGALAILVRALVDPLATRLTRKGLDGLDGYRGDFERVHVTLLQPGYVITRLKVIEAPGGSWKTPLFYAERVSVAVQWHQLLRGRIVAAVRVIDPKIQVVQRPTPKTKLKEDIEEVKAKAPYLSQHLQTVIPLQVARIEVVRGEALFRDLTAPRHPELWVHGLDLTLDNLPTRARLANGRPTTIQARGKVGRTGDLRLFVSADPFARPLEFGGRFQIEGLHVSELFDFIEPKTELQTPKGTMDLYAQFTAKDGRFHGGVKPVLKGVEVRAAKPGVWTRLKGWFADKAVETASDREPAGGAVATVVPIEGRLTDPKLQLWPAILGVVRNAFVEGVTSGFSNVPPPKAGEEQGVLKQTTDALDKEKGPPKAQPEKD